MTSGPGDGAALGGFEMTTESGWFAERPSGTEDVHKIYAQSFAGPGQLETIQMEAQHIVSSVICG